MRSRTPPSWREWLVAFVLAALAGVRPISAAEEVNDTPARATLTAANPDQPKGVLLLFDERSDFPGLVLLDRSLTSALNAGTAGRLEIYREFMDRARFPDPHHAAEFQDHLQQKYAGKRIDVIVAALGPSLEFLVNRRTGLFQGVPIVFAGIDRREIDGRNMGPDVTGVLVSREFKPTLEIALKLHPGTRRVVFIGGAADFNRYWEERARREFREFENRVAITYLTDVAMADILKEVASLPPHTIILFLHLFKDAAGTSFKPNEAVSLIAQKAAAPIYVFLDQYLGHGVVGGHVYSLEAHGAKAAEMALRVLGGEKPASIPMLEGGSNVTMFDWRELRRWGIDENRLPPGAVVRFREASFWELYRWHVAAAIAIIAAQAALIVALLVHRRRRRLAELEVQRQRSALAHASALAVVGELTASIAHEINQPLGAILSNTDAAELLLEAGAPHESIRQIMEDIRKDDRRASDVIQRLRALLRKHEIEARPFDLNEAIADALRVVRADAERRRVAIDAEFAALPSVRGDRTHIQQVLLNLIVNGMDAMVDTHVTRRRLVVRTARAGGDLEVSVTDAGPGIPPERMPKLFESFFTTKQSGMGLGLSIARSIVEAHGGRIRAENNPGGGATFRFTLPARAADADSAPTAAQGRDNEAFLSAGAAKRE